LNYFSLEVKLENPCKRAVIDQETISFWITCELCMAASSKAAYRSRSKIYIDHLSILKCSLGIGWVLASFRSNIK
jgi:hypothetical protein